MAMMGRPKPALVLTDEERSTLKRLATRRKSAQALAMRCRIVLGCATGATNAIVAAELGVSGAMVGKWRSRFVAERLDGLLDAPRPGATRTITDDQVEAVIVKTLEEKPKDRDALVDTVDGQGDRDEPDRYLEDLAGLRTAASSGRELQALH